MLELTPENGRIFRITHIENIAWILANGLHCRNAGVSDPNYRDIGNPDIIERRHRRSVPVGPGGSLSDYIPFYLTPYSPMLYNIVTGHNGVKQLPSREIVILTGSLRRLAEHHVSFLITDRHAALAAAKFTAGASGLERIDWPLLQARDFSRDPNDPGKIERYQAEVLVHRHVPVPALDAIVCRGPSQQAELEQLAGALGCDVDVASKPDWYFS